MVETAAHRHVTTVAEVRLIAETRLRDEAGPSVNRAP